ncbi:hypothetical protein Mgra_00005501 [Meloidogyne graminicola]|uniref:Uncharacterized protein n=1 Tax=Meloidogyne graminicola TaxID=189291 RepID=A0A8S9ZNR0_9BILA|nr:hypothetical protein Mgra_00005501 [Meloidogyne graminicola]
MCDSIRCIIYPVQTLDVSIARGIPSRGSISDLSKQAKTRFTLRRSSQYSRRLTKLMLNNFGGMNKAIEKETEKCESSIRNCIHFIKDKIGRKNSVFNHMTGETNKRVY